MVAADGGLCRGQLIPTSQCWCFTQVINISIYFYLGNQKDQYFRPKRFSARGCGIQTPVAVSTAGC
jgi:hypothetical protein